MRARPGDGPLVPLVGTLAMMNSLDRSALRSGQQFYAVNAVGGGLYELVSGAWTPAAAVPDSGITDAKLGVLMAAQGVRAGAAGTGGNLVALDGENFDTAAIHDNVTNDTRLTCVKAGLYLVVGWVEVTNGGSGGITYAELRKNGTKIASEGANGGSVSMVQGWAWNPAQLVRLAVSDYIELYAGSMSQYLSGATLSMIRLGD
jgi:hypothetical protein